MNKLLLILLIALFPATSTAQNIVGKWKVTKAVPYAKTNDKEASRIIKEYVGSFLEYEYDIYMQFSENGIYTEYFLDHQTDSKYTIKQNKLKIYNRYDSLREPSYSIKNDTLLLDYDHTKNYDSDRLRRIDVPNYESVKATEIGQRYYLEKLPDDYSIADSLHKKMLEQSIIVESKNPDNVKNDILGEWVYWKVEPVVITNNKNTSEYLKGLINMSAKENNNNKIIIFNKDSSIYEDYRKKPYTIDGNQIEIDNKELGIFAVNDSVLSIEEDLKSSLVWIGIGISDDPVSVVKFAARTYYKRRKNILADVPRYEGTWDIINSNLQYPPNALRDRIEGTVIVLFTVNEDGSLSDFKIHESIHPDIDAEAIRLVKLTSKLWTPKKENGIAVSGVSGLGIRFELPESNK